MNDTITNAPLGPNSLANNSPDRKPTLAQPFQTEGPVSIREVEVSVNRTCNLSCFGCGFNVPNQPNPVIGDGIEQHVNSLRALKNLGITIGKIVIVGGEATLASSLDSHVRQLREMGNGASIELVTNGLYPRGLQSSALSQLDSLVISDYVRSSEFEELWEKYAEQKGFLGKPKFRRKPEGGWDDLLSEVKNSYIATRNHWDSCFYRKYDVTLERGRLFTCSRIAKKEWDDQGLVLDDSTTYQDIQLYLNASTPKAACYSCATVGCSSKIPVAQQTTTDLQKIFAKTIIYLEKETSDDK
jgi:organic radical activating enzyme